MVQAAKASRGTAAGWKCLTLAGIVGLVALVGPQPARAQVFNPRAEHDRRAHDLFERGRLEEAVVEWREALKFAPESLPIRRNLGLVLLKLGRSEEAEEELLEALSLEPNNALTHLYLGRTYIDQGKLRMAASELETAQALEPTNPDVDISLALLNMRQGRYDKAEAHIQRALTFNYNDPNLHAALGDIYRAQGKWDKADEAYQAALELDASHPGAKRGLKEAQAGRQGKRTFSGIAKPSQRPTFFGGDKRSKEDVINVSIPEIGTEGGQPILRGFVVNVGDHPVASIDLNFMVIDKSSGRIHAQRFAKVEREILKPGEKTDYTLEWEEGLEPGRFRLQMKVAWAELLDSPGEGPSPEEAPPGEAPDTTKPEVKLPRPMPEPLPSQPRQ